ncbi:bifunctional 2-C-methyl-D-erythritol 4-phosphate cytidylyltransferase/2-C-methyl-D-erythritol 2,4-cyclodiphosphate synthase [Qipengyuania sp.]|uniref:bifunctional 2-C-methyl-D-erythritol 4-phosphate cytidylyltransferase/2-C-methyl-D-erythritol 2,4-cyclodiphosphate synthase n=1 Tax=Qipengyuania sp. TaxID=2004515 RepID=UPI0035C84067
MLLAPPFPPFAAIVVAAGTGSRTGLGVPKQFACWRGKPLVRHSVEALRQAGASPVVVVIPVDGEVQAKSALLGIEQLRLVAGAATRQASVKAGLEALADDAPPHVLIHDAARPDLPPAVIARLRDALATTPGAIPVLPVVDSLVVEAEGFMAERAKRETLRRVQTPQAFRFADILAAHRGWQGASDAGDDAQVLKAAGGDIVLVAGDSRLAKLTFAEDFGEETRPPPALAPGPAPATVRVGFGYDVHRLAAGEELWLGGVLIPHDRGLAGHSDADVLLHALVDAILGALGQGDIGTHFPPSDPQWRGAASSLFVDHAIKLARAQGFTLAHTDCTIICEAPKIGPHRPAMRERIARLLGVDMARVSVKATTTEGLGFAGRGEGIAAHAVVTLAPA